jgi:hypothetical protein
MSAPSSANSTLRFIAWLSVAGVILALLGVHVLLGRGLLAIARGERRGV